MKAIKQGYVIRVRVAGSNSTLGGWGGEGTDT